MRDQPHSLQARRIERLLRRIEELRAWRNARETTIPTWQFTAPDGSTASLTLGDFWPVVDLPVTLTATATIPPEWAGQPVELELWLGGEALVRLSTGLQAGLNPMHHRFPVTESATGGETITIEAEAVPKGIFGGRIEEPRIERAHLVIPHRAIRALERDLTMLREACIERDEHEVVPFLLDAAEHALSELADGWPSDTPTALSRYALGYESGLGSGVQAVPHDWQGEAIDAARPTGPTWSLPAAPRPLEAMPARGIAAVERARAVLAEGLASVRARYPPVGALCLTGHAHIDLAWLWPLAETRRKIRRTFSTVIDLMDRYPDFTFNQSSARAYAWIEEDDPALFARIRERVAEGRWEPTGGMWVEPDCMITGGESLVRQILYGQRYFERAFGKRHTNAWLPDVFGFSGGMPQILRDGGLTGFFTIKLNWNESNRLPHDLFRWEGVDGSAVIAHLFFNPGHGYNGNIVPLDVLGTWRNYRDKTRHGESLLAFGWGDGAGGPSEKMLENYARLKDFPAFPRLRMGRADEFFAALPDPETLPAWVGELYLELHRGTLTSQALVKTLNREAEHRLVEAEAFAALVALDGSPYPGETIERAWKTLLLNQFHDILPGSSISEVYIDAHRQLREVVATATTIRNTAIATRSGNDSDGSGWQIVNPTLRDCPALALLSEVDSEQALVDDRGVAVVTQPVPAGTLIYLPHQAVPALGSRAVHPGTGSAPGWSPAPAAATQTAEGIVLENGQIRVQIALDGAITSLVDVSLDREVIDGRANVLMAYVDKPRAWDAWDIDETYERDGIEIDGIVRVEIIESGPIRASVEVERRWRSSRILQTYRLTTGSARLDVESEIDWQERQTLLRTAFPLALHTHEATFETMYGAVRRPTHRNTTWDQAKFEASGHRWADLSEPGYGVALLNDGKYGHGAHGNVLSLSILRAPMYPDPLADLGAHRFAYALFPHAGAWSEAGVVAEAIAFNSPLIVAPVPATATDSPGFVRSEGIELTLGALKRADDRDGLILRLHEPNGARGIARLVFARQIESAARANILEDDLGADGIHLDRDNRTLTFSVRPFELITLRLRFA